MAQSVRSPSITLMSGIGGGADIDFACWGGANNGLLLLRFLGRLHDDAIRAQQQAASEKRQGTKSREVGYRRCRNDYGDLAVSMGVQMGDEKLWDGRYGGDGRARQGESTWKKAGNTAAVWVGTGNRVGGAVAGG